MSASGKPKINLNRLQPDKASAEKRPPTARLGTDRPAGAGNGAADKQPAAAAAPLGGTSQRRGSVSESSTAAGSKAAGPPGAKAGSAFLKDGARASSAGGQ